MHARARAMLAIAATLLLGAGLSACSSDAGGASKGTSSHAEGMTTVRITSLSLCSELSLYALDTGIFAKHGLNVKRVNVQSGSAGIAAVQGGSADMAWVSPQALLTAIDQGIPLKIISDSGETTKASQGIIVNSKSGITGPADLQGKTVAVNDLNGTIITMINNWVRAATGKKPSVKYVALGFSDIEPAVENGKVDAGAVPAPDVEKITASGKGRSIGNPTFDGVGATPNALYAVASPWLAKHEAVAKSFVAAMQDAADQAKQPANAGKKFDIFSKYCKTPAATLAKIPEIAYSGYVDMTALDNAVKLFKQAKILKPDFDVSAAVPAFARAKAS